MSKPKKLLLQNPIKLADLKRAAKIAAKPATLQDDRAAAQLHLREQEAGEAVTRYQKLLQRVAVEEKVIGQFRERIEEYLGASKLVIPVAPPLAKPAARRRRTEEDAILCLSDTHIWKILHPSQTMGFGHYNPRIFLERLAHMENVVVRLLRENIHNPVRRLHVLILGDIIEGALDHGQEIPQRGLVVDQVLLAGLVLHQFIARLSRIVPVTVRGLGGNHCVDRETEIFTRRGWLKSHEVTEQDECLGLKPEGGEVVWQPIREVIRQRAVDRMVTVKNRQFSFRGTEHHRFYYHIPGHPMLNVAPWSQIHALPIKIPTAGHMQNSGAEVPDHLIELSAAILTDGCLNRGRVIVSQKSGRDSWVKAAFDKSGLPYTVRHRTRPKPASICGRALTPGSSTECSYELRAEAARECMELTGLAKERLPDWAWRMKGTQFSRFLGALLAGDGTSRPDNPNSSVLYGKRGHRWLGEVQALCALHGVTASVSAYSENPNPQWRLNIFHSTSVSLGATAEIAYDTASEEVWCVVTGTGNFLCRRDGKSYFTGNSRWQNQRKMPTENRYSNFDFIALGMAQALLSASGTDRVQFLLEENAFQYFTLGEWGFKIGHGDHLKGGDRALGVPAHAIGREVNATTQRFNARGLRAPDYYLVGDKHRHMSVQTARGRYMVNGAFFDSDNYALTENFTPGRPYQMFFGVHPTIGKSWAYDLWLDNAPRLAALPYVLPARLAEKVGAFDH